jgi:LmbE family N-acetylglucosaminyl deacetylase
MLNLRPGHTSESGLRVLCLGAHSDDIEIGCGGLLLSLSQQVANLHVDWVVFSAAGPRGKEARAGAKLFLTGAASSKVTLHTFRDGFFPHQPRIKETFETLKRLPPPDVVLTHYRDDRHQDHRVLSDLTWNTFRDHWILEYEIPKYDGDLGSPNLFVPLDKDTCLRKAEYLTRTFGTQRDKHWFTDETFLGLMRLRGLECRAPSGYAEAFYSRKAVWNPVA